MVKPGLLDAVKAALELVDAPIEPGQQWREMASAHVAIKTFQGDRYIKWIDVSFDQIRALVTCCEQAEAENVRLRVQSQQADEAVYIKRLDSELTAVRELRQEADVHAEATRDWTTERAGMGKRVKEAETALAALREQMCETCQHVVLDWRNEMTNAACALLSTGKPNGVMSCRQVGHRCGAWARREP